MSQIINQQYFDLLCRLNLRLGFYGGSFDPFHEGHYNIAVNSIKKLNLDKLIILVAHYSSTKIYSSNASDRAQYIQSKIHNPKILISNLEEILDFRCTHPTAKYISIRSYKKPYMILGADSIIDFHKWESYYNILNFLKIVVFDRYGFTYKSLNCKSSFAIDEFYKIPYKFISSTQIRSGFR